MNDIQIKSDKAAYNILAKLHQQLVMEIEAAMQLAGDLEEREILVGLICGAARHYSDQLTPKPTPTKNK